MHSDYLIVGTGITGATMARLLHDAGKDVLLLDRRDAIGGNVHDVLHESGIRVHTYGPHYFRTNDQQIWNFVNRFSNFFEYRAIVESLVDGKHESWPVNETYLSSLSFSAKQISFTGIPTSFEEACLATMPAVVYEKFVKGYTQKQWGVPPRTLSSGLAGRFNVRKDCDRHFSQHNYQGIPYKGYSHFMRQLVEGIPRLLGIDYLAHRSNIKGGTLTVYTGAIDAFFNFDLGRLRYRAQRREHNYKEDFCWLQPVGQVNNPSLHNGRHIRTLEWKHMMPTDSQVTLKGTVTTKEFPYTPSDPDAFEYPFPDLENQVLYRKYRERADLLPRTLICGRLGEYRYYDMDQAIARATMLARPILAHEIDPHQAPAINEPHPLQ